MCCCCFGCCGLLSFCSRVYRPYPKPRYRYRGVSAAECGLFAVLAALLLGVSMWTTSTPYKVQHLSLVDSLVVEVATRLERASDARSGLGTDDFRRWGSDEAPINPEHNDNARAQLEWALSDIEKAAEEEELDEAQLRVCNDFYSIEDLFVPAAEEEVSVRVYTPLMRCRAQMPVVVLLHPGGFVFGSKSDATSSFVASTVLRHTGAVVVSVDYRLAPEHPFPAAVHDADAVVKWVLSGALGEHTNTSHVLVMGVEAGGNLAAVASMLARDRAASKHNAKTPFGLICVHPWFLLHNTSSRARFYNTTLNYAARADWLEKLYNHQSASRPELADPVLAPGGLAGMPPTHNCPLQDDSKHLIDALKEAQVPVDHKHDSACASGFLGLPLLRNNEVFWEWVIRAILEDPPHAW